MRIIQYTEESRIEIWKRLQKTYGLSRNVVNFILYEYTNKPKVKRVISGCDSFEKLDVDTSVLLFLKETVQSMFVSDLFCHKEYINAYCKHFKCRYLMTDHGYYLGSK